MKRLFVCALLALFTACDMPTEPPVKAPPVPDEPAPVVITGRIVESRGAAGVQGAFVRVPEAGVHAGTDKTGRYTITLPARFRGRVVSLQARAIGYNARNQMVTVTRDAVTVDLVMTVARFCCLCEVVIVR